ncbi:tyrosine-type recombinase/integrase [Gryllotalpicola koreensis]|uniref:Site-specific integrase n=1 Tax=Gryllotalpicola koreensis TaxID=993086 RepID=A0ABP8A2L8_9MICO
MSTIKAYETAAGKRYRVRYRKPDGSQTDKRGFRTKRDAELFAATVEVKKARGEYVDPSLGRVTVAERSKSWLSAKKARAKASYYRTLEIAWHTHVEERWGGIRLVDIEFSDVQDWVSELAEKRSATVVIRAHGILAGILDTAVRDRRLARNEARGVVLPRKRKKKHVYLSHLQVEQLAAESREKATLVRVLAYTGVRWGEATALRVSDVDFGRRRLYVHENAVRVGPKTVVDDTKGGKARWVPFAPFLEFGLRAAAKGKRADELLFGDGENYLKTPDYRDGWYAGAKKRAGLPESLTIHDLRHSAASFAVAAGANVKALQRMLGHESAAMTLDVYADLFDDDLDKVADALERSRDEALGATA